MEEKRILTIQDISCVGQCSLTVALPILSVCGHETAVMPSAVLSTHTAAGFAGFTFRDLTDDMPKISQHWQKKEIYFDAVYTGYLGSIKQIEYVKDIIKSHRKSTTITFIDPAMADNGKLYVSFNNDFVKAMASLVTSADFILPNITEACLLTETPYQEHYDEEYINNLLHKLIEQGAKNIILTGVSYSDDTTGVVVIEGGKTNYYQHKKISKGCHGTGDIFASTFVGSYLAQHSAFESAKIAADFTVACIENTIDDPSHWYGVKFESVLPRLIKRLGK